MPQRPAGRRHDTARHGSARRSTERGARLIVTRRRPGVGGTADQPDRTTARGPRLVRTTDVRRRPAKPADPEARRRAAANAARLTHFAPALTPQRHRRSPASPRAPYGHSVTRLTRFTRDADAANAA
nr:hypothetical protein GCM10017588_60400 [Microbispora rosea subsp. aerata]